MNPHYNIKQTVNRSRLARLVLSTIAGIVFTLSAQAVVPLTYMWQNISSDIHGVAPFFNPYLVNPWGIAGWPGGEDTFVTADNGSGVVTIHNPLGDAVIATTGTAVFTSGSAATVFEITVPVPVSGTNTVSAPTGVVINRAGFSGSTGFIVSSGSAGPSAPSEFIVVTEDGIIAGYNPVLSASNAFTAVDNSASNAVYKGAALTYSGTGSSAHHYLYATNFYSGKIEVYDQNWSPVTLPLISGSIPAFADPVVTGTTYAPFNIKRLAYEVLDAATGKKTLTRRLFVTYALQSEDKLTAVAGLGLGYVNEFDTEGKFIRTVVQPGGPLDAPWGLAFHRAPLGGKYVLLVGNRGDGVIHAFDLYATVLPHLGPLKTKAGDNLRFDGLWALHFGRPKETLKNFLLDEDEIGENKDLYFNAGIVDGDFGLRGTIIPD